MKTREIIYYIVVGVFVLLFIFGVVVAVITS